MVFFYNVPIRQSDFRANRFIAGIDTMIDEAVADIPSVEKGFRAIFSASPFPGANLKLDWRRGESGGN